MSVASTNPGRRARPRSAPGLFAESTIVACACLVLTASPCSAEAFETVFSTLIGGSSEDQVRDVAATGDGGVFVTGGSSSPGFPTQPNGQGFVYDATHNGDYDVFVMRFDASGTLLWSTFIGGPNYDRAYAIDVDGDGDLWIAGRAGDGFPVTAGAFQTQFRGGRANSGDPYFEQDGFVCKMSPSGAVLWCSYFGANDGRIVRDVAAAPNGDAYVVASYFSGSYPASVASRFLNSPLGDEDNVAARVSADGSQLVWARYVGGSQADVGTGSAASDAESNAFFAFGTRSSGIATSGAYDTTYAGNGDIVVTKLDANGNVEWASYFGGTGFEETETHEMTVDSVGRVFLAIGTGSPLASIPDSPGTIRRSYGSGGGAIDAVVARLSSDGARLEALTSFGGSGSDRPEGMSIDAAGAVHLTGITSSSNFPYVAAQAIGPTSGNRAIAARIDADFTLGSATTIGGAALDYGRAADVDDQGSFFFAGLSTSGDWPAVQPLQSGNAGNGDGFLVKLVPAPAICPALPATGCRSGEAGKSRLQLKDRRGPGKDRLVWKLRNGEATAAQDFPDPRSAPTVYALCLYDGSGSSQPLVELDPTRAPVCGRQDCWSDIGVGGYKFRDRAGSSDGVRKIVLRAGEQGSTRVDVKAKGDVLELDLTPLVEPVSVQLLVDDGVAQDCWSTVLPDVSRNEPGLFKAKGP